MRGKKYRALKRCDVIENRTPDTKHRGKTDTEHRILLGLLTFSTPPWKIKHRGETNIGNYFIPFPYVFAFTALFSIFNKIWTLEKGKNSQPLIRFKNSDLRGLGGNLAPFLMFKKCSKPRGRGNFSSLERLQGGHRTPDTGHRTPDTIIFNS